MLPGFAGIVGFAGGAGPASISSAWSAIDLVYTTVNGTNEDRTITWTGGGTRNIDYAGASFGTFEYRIDSGSWLSYSSPFALSSGQTVGWRYTPTGDESVTIEVNVDSVLLTSFGVSATGYP
jgi:hypothetical protein